MLSTHVAIRWISIILGGNTGLDHAQVVNSVILTNYDTVLSILLPLRESKYGEGVGDRVVSLPIGRRTIAKGRIAKKGWMFEFSGFYVSRRFI